MSKSRKSTLSQEWKIARDFLESGELSKCEDNWRESPVKSVRALKQAAKYFFKCGDFKKDEGLKTRFLTVSEDITDQVMEDPALLEDISLVWSLGCLLSYVGRDEDALDYVEYVIEHTQNERMLKNAVDKEKWIKKALLKPHPTTVHTSANTAETAAIIA